MNQTCKHLIAATATWCVAFAGLAAMRPPVVTPEVVVLREAGTSGVVDADPVPSSNERPADTILSSHAIEGRLVGFERGDYLHAVIRDKAGRRHSFFVWSDGLSYFLARTKGRTLRLEYEVADTYFMEAGGVERIERVVHATGGREDSEVWWRSQRRARSQEQLDAEYDPLVDRYTLN